MRDLAEVSMIDHFPHGGMDRRGAANANDGTVRRAPKRASFPADRLTVPAKGVLIRIPVSIDMFDDCAIRDKHLPQPDLEVSIAVDEKDAFLTARLNGASFRRTMRRVRDDQRDHKPLGRLFIVGRIVTPGVITDPGLQYEYV